MQQVSPLVFMEEVFQSAEATVGRKHSPLKMTTTDVKGDGRRVRV